MSTESLLKAYKAALRFSDLGLYEDYSMHTWAASSVEDVIEHNRMKFGEYINYDMLQEEEWDTADKRLGFALLISQTCHPFTPSGIKKFANHCLAVNDEIALNEIKSVLSDLDESESESESESD